MCPKIFRNVSHPGQEISLYWPNFIMEVSQLMDLQTYKKFRIIWIHCENIAGKPPKKFRKISHQEQEISPYLSNFSKEVRQLTDWQTYKKFGYPWILMIVSRDAYAEIQYHSINIDSDFQFSFGWAQGGRE